VFKIAQPIKIKNLYLYLYIAIAFAKTFLHFTSIYTPTILFYARALELKLTTRKKVSLLLKQI